MTRHTDLIENTVQLRNNVIDLSGQVTCVDSHLAVREESKVGNGHGARAIEEDIKMWRRKGNKTSVLRRSMYPWGIKTKAGLREAADNLRTFHLLSALLFSFFLLLLLLPWQ